MRPKPDQRIAAYIAALDAEGQMAWRVRPSTSHITLRQVQEEHGTDLVALLLKDYFSKTRVYDATLS